MSTLGHPGNRFAPAPKVQAREETAISPVVPLRVLRILRVFPCPRLDIEEGFENAHMRSQCVRRPMSVSSGVHAGQGQTVADTVAGASLDGVVPVWAAPPQLSEITTESKPQQIELNGRSEIMSPLL